MNLDFLHFQHSRYFHSKQRSYSWQFFCCFESENSSKLSDFFCPAPDFTVPKYSIRKMSKTPNKGHSPLSSSNFVSALIGSTISPPPQKLSVALPISAKQSAKKRQNQLKQIVHQFGEVLLIWLADLTEIRSLLESLVSLYSNIKGFHSTFLNSSYWKLQSCSLPDLHQRLLASMFTDIESNMAQIKSSQ